jgi:hypothetical protein
MAPASKRAVPRNKSRCLYSLHPWKCRHHTDHSEIVAYVETSSEWKVVLTAHPTAGASAEMMASFIGSLVNDNQKNKHLLLAAMEALELCQNEGEMTFSSEQAVDSVVTRIKQRLK